MNAYILIQSRGEYSDHTTTSVRIYRDRVRADKAEAMLVEESYRCRIEYIAWCKEHRPGRALMTYPDGNGINVGRFDVDGMNKWDKMTKEKEKPSQIMLAIDPTCQIWDDWYVEECEIED